MSLSIVSWENGIEKKRNARNRCLIMILLIVAKTASVSLRIFPEILYENTRGCGIPRTWRLL